MALFGFRLEPSTFGIFAVFPGEADLQALPSNEVQGRLEKADALLTAPHSIQKVEVLAAKLPKQ